MTITFLAIQLNRGTYRWDLNGTAKPTQPLVSSARAEFQRHWMQRALYPSQFDPRRWDQILGIHTIFLEPTLSNADYLVRVCTQPSSPPTECAIRRYVMFT